MGQNATVHVFTAETATPGLRWFQRPASEHIADYDCLEQDAEEFPGKPHPSRSPGYWQSTLGATSTIWAREQKAERPPCSVLLDLREATGGPDYPGLRLWRPP